tara:strand:+ start:177 stop:605 length:429 start_codon:yes stop_codon:yes gene_type:complete
MTPSDLPDDPLELLARLDSLTGKINNQVGSYKGRTPTDDILEEISEKLEKLIEKKPVNPEHAIAVKQLKKLKAEVTISRAKERFKLNQYSDKAIQDIADSTRKKNGKINYTQMGRKLGVDADTVKRYIFQNNLTHLIDGNKS